jgi:hypothetical protein
MHNVCFENGLALAEENGVEMLAAGEVRGRKCLKHFGVPNGNEVHLANLRYDGNAARNVEMDGQRDEFIQQK